jgi:N utilization substance protein A
LDNENGKAEVYLKPDQVSLAIGKGGFNIKLAGELTGFDIDVYRDTEEEVDDVQLDEFTDELDAWVIKALKSIGCDTARSVLEIPVADLVRRTDLEEETVKEVVGVLAAEFED